MSGLTPAELEKRKELSNLVQSASVHSLYKSAVSSTFRLLLPLADGTITMAVFSESSPFESFDEPTLQKIKRATGSVNRGFLALAEFILDGAEILSIPVYGLDLETGELNFIEAVKVILDRNRIGFPCLKKENATSVLYLDFVGDRNPQVEAVKELEGV